MTGGCIDAKEIWIVGYEEDEYNLTVEEAYFLEETTARLALVFLEKEHPSLNCYCSKVVLDDAAQFKYITGGEEL